MTESELKLREAAKLATPGTWKVKKDSMDDKVIGMGSYLDDPYDYLTAHMIPYPGNSWDDPEAKANAKFITLANPEAILSLLERLEGLEKTKQRCDRSLCDSCPACGFSGWVGI
jgi:hypothetical protein